MYAPPRIPALLNQLPLVFFLLCPYLQSSLSIFYLFSFLPLFYTFMHKPITLFVGLLWASHAALTQQVQPQPWSKASSFETSGQAPPLFPAQHQVVQGNPLYTRTGNQSVLLNARQGNAYLLSEALPVHKGEVLQVEAHAHYVTKANSKPLAKLATAVAATSAVAILSNATKSNGNGDTRLTQSKLPFLSLGVALPTALIASYRKVPRAYLQYALYARKESWCVPRLLPYKKQLKVTGKLYKPVSW